jgi:hypothetical protein
MYQCLGGALQNNWGLDVGLTTPTCKTVIVTKPSRKEGRPKPTPGCSAEGEEECLGGYLLSPSRFLKMEAVDSCLPNYM